MRIKAFAKSEMVRTKTDRIDAHWVALRHACARPMDTTRRKSAPYKG
jgi:hypothetical protein